MIAFTDEQMTEMGFEVITYEDALSWGFAPSKDADPIWQHVTCRTIWMQGAFASMGFIESIITEGVKRGSMETQRRLRELLGL